MFGRGAVQLLWWGLLRLCCVRDLVQRLLRVLVSWRCVRSGAGQPHAELVRSRSLRVLRGHELFLFRLFLFGFRVLVLRRVGDVLHADV